MSLTKILRSVLDVDGKIPQDDLKRNYAALSGSDLRLPDAEDQDIWDFIQGFATQFGELPKPQSLHDYYEREGEAVTSERLKEVQATFTTYTGADFEALVHDVVEGQRDQDLHIALKTANDILFNGMSMKEGRKTLHLKGYRDAMLYLMKHSDRLMSHSSGSRTKADIVEDTDFARDEMNRVLAAEKLTWGCLCGLEDIDVVCRGLKPGEMWTHAASTGELKCMAGDTLVFNHDTKKLESVRDLYNHNALPVVTALKHEGAEPLLVQAQASHLVENGEREVFEVRTSSGRTVTLTANHPLWTAEGGGSWREVGELSEGTWVGVPSVMKVPQPRTDFSDAEVQAIGLLLGDGTLGKSTFGLTATCTEVQDVFIACLEVLGYQEGPATYETLNWCREETSDRAPFLRVSRSLGLGNSEMVSPLAARLRSLGLWQVGSHEKFIPGELFGLPDTQIALLLGALWATDGSCHTGDHERPDRTSDSRRNDITYTSVSRKLAVGVQGLLLRLGIPSTVRPVATTYKDEPYLFYTVRVITRPGKQQFCAQVVVPGKRERFEVLANRLPCGDDRVFPSELLAGLEDNHRVATDTGSWRYVGQARKRAGLTADSLALFTTLKPELERHLGGEVAWEQIESITPKGVEMTYDLSVPEHHSFVVNDIITHNTSFALNWIYRAAFLLQYNVYYLSMEMSVEHLQRIMYVMHSNHPKFQGQGWPKLTYRVIRDGEDEAGNPITAEQIAFYDHIIDDIEANRGHSYGSVYVHSPDEDMTIPKLKQAMEMRHAQTPIHMCVIDHFALLKPAEFSGNYYTDLNSILRDAKRLALTFNQGERVGVLGLLQINRQGKLDADKSDGVYRTQALADANEAERSSDVITTTYLNAELRARGRTKFGCLKNRDNPHFLPFTALIDWDTRYMANEVDFGNHASLLNAATDDEIENIMAADTARVETTQREREEAQAERRTHARTSRPSRMSLEDVPDASDESEEA